MIVAFSPKSSFSAVPRPVSGGCCAGRFALSGAVLEDTSYWMVPRTEPLPVSAEQSLGLAKPAKLPVVLIVTE